MTSAASSADIQLTTQPAPRVWSYLAPFPKNGDLLAKNCLFFLPSLIRRPRSLGSLWNFAPKLSIRKLQSKENGGGGDGGDGAILQ